MGPTTQRNCLSNTAQLRFHVRLLVILMILGWVILWEVGLMFLLAPRPGQLQYNISFVHWPPFYIEVTYIFLMH